jgi:hypothetical protein
MIDSKSVVQEVQKELLAALQRGQDHVRKSQEQVRRGRDAVAGAVRAGTELTKAARPSVPARPTVHIPGPAQLRAHAQELAGHAQELAGHAITAQRELAGKAWHVTSPYAERVITAQRGLAERARQAGLAEHAAAAQRTVADKVAGAAKAATPFVAEGRTRLTQLVGGLQGGRSTATAPAASTGKSIDAPSAAPKPTATKATATKAPAAKAPAAKPIAAKSAPAKSAAKRAATATAKPAATAAKPKARTTKSGATRSAASSKPSGTTKK